ncbi:MAG: MazG family protein [Acidobacteria bacterium]|nr:MazG family protein [Acidobacteriota bacterium]
MKPKVTVVGLGPGGPDLVTAGTLEQLARVPVRYLRTTRHPAAVVVDAAASFDDVYDAADRIDDVYPAIVEALVELAAVHGEVAYAVPGSPRVAERSVELLLLDDRVEVDVVPAMSFLDLAWVRLGIDPLAAGVRVVDGHRFAVEAAGERGPLLVAQCDSTSVLSDVKLAVEGEPPASVLVLQRLGLPDESVQVLAWADLDREVVADHLTSLYIPALAEPVGHELLRLAEVSRILREQCPWDRQQTHASLTRYLLEESYEVVEAVEHLDRGDDGAYDHLEEELGDVLMQVFFHAAIATESGAFTVADVARGITEKLVRRHPHVFGDVEVAGADEVLANWDVIKREEKGRESVMDGVTSTLPGLAFANETLKKAATLGIGPPAGPEIADDDTLGRALLDLVAAARRAGLDAEAAVRRAAARLADQARAAEKDG